MTKKPINSNLYQQAGFNDKNEFFEDLESKFNNQELLKLALVHSSYSDENNNEKLEFLGDSLLNFLISCFLFQNSKYKHNEGTLSLGRANLVNKNTLVTIGIKLGLAQKIYHKTNNDPTPGMIADCFEAIIGAIYIDRGFKVSKDFVLNCYKTMVLNKDFDHHKHPISLLQEKLQELHLFNCLPLKYHKVMISERKYIITLVIGNHQYETTNISYKDGKKELAIKALKDLYNTVDGVS